MRYIKLLVASVILVSMTACVADNESDLDKLGYIKTINVIGPDEIAFEQISGAGQTKATSVDAGSALVFRWAAGDTLGIFPNKGGQVEFPITTQESSTSASFDGGGWALRNNASYAAYYPFSVWNCFQSNKTIVLDYSGQVQNGNGSFDHLSAYDYLASAKTTPENGSVTFQMDRQGSILYIDIVVPEPATITSLTISCDEAIFVEKAALDISGNNPVVTPIEAKESLTLNFENTATTYQYEIVRAYMAVLPVDFSSKTVTATLRTSAGIYTAPVVSRVVNKGKAAFLRFSDSFTNGSNETTTISQERYGYDVNLDSRENSTGNFGKNGYGYDVNLDSRENSTCNIEKGGYGYDVNLDLHENSTSNIEKNGYGEDANLDQNSDGDAGIDKEGYGGDNNWDTDDNTSGGINKSGYSEDLKWD